MIKSVIWCLLLSFSFLSPFARAQNADPYNAYRFNRYNWEQGISSVDQGPWYEWWYYKVVTPQGRSFFWVYGVINPADGDAKNPASRAYVKIGDFEKKEMGEEVFPAHAFQASYDSTNIQIANSPFSASDKFLKGEMLNKVGKPISWDLTLEKEWSWNAMGWGLPLNDFVNIAWYPAQASARMSGTLQWGDETIVLDGAKAYQDRNWGTGFPEWWYWIAANEFIDAPEASLACGGGLPQTLGLPIMEVLTCGLKIGDEELSFRSNDLTLYDYELGYGKWHLSFEKLDKKLVVDAWAPEEKFMDLIFLSPQNVEFHDFETLNGNVTVQLFTRKGLDWQKTREFKSQRAGIEWGSEDPHPSYSIEAPIKKASEAVKAGEL